MFRLVPSVKGLSTGAGGTLSMRARARSSSVHERTVSVEILKLAGRNLSMILRNRARRIY